MQMSKIAFIYPGQGAQAVGMGMNFYEKSPLSKAVFDQASEAVDLDLKKLCFEENDLLDKTEYTQVAMVTACLAMTRAVEAMGLHADMTAGLSLGEYCAIALAGGMCAWMQYALFAPEGFLWNMQHRKEPGQCPQYSDLMQQSLRMS